MQKVSAAGRTPRLHVPGKLAEGAIVMLDGGQAHYLTRVMRLGEGASFRIFNGEDGEWLGEIVEIRKREVVLRCDKRMRLPSPPPDIDYLFAPLKHARIDYVAQKATEMGVRRLRPVLTRHTIADRVNVDRVRANAVEAA